MKKISLLLILALIFSLGCTSPQPEQKIDLTIQGWHGNAICYSGYRDGQNPQKYIYPSQEEIAEDLRIIEKQWDLIRIYGADQHSLDILTVIRNEKIDLKVMLGIWLDGEPGYEEDNSKQVSTGIKLANEFQDIVIAVNVGNEILIHWSDHKVPEDKVIKYVTKVQDSTSVPVTVADDWIFWRDHGAKLADVVDFVVVHLHPIWAKQDIDTGITWVEDGLNAIKKALPGKTLVLGETGWATYTIGDLHFPKAGDEVKQKQFYFDLVEWAKSNNITTFNFEAFDEPWKGSGTEGHWGLFTEDRKAKLAMQELYPELMPDGPTSPNYEE